MSKKNRPSASGSSGKNADVADDRIDESPRRSFLKSSVAAGVAACAIGTPVCAGARAVLAPVFHESQTGKFYPLAAVDTLTDKPQRFDVVDDKRDAWTTLPKQKIGSVYLRKEGDSISAFHTLCPHAGCMVHAGIRKNPQTGQDQEMFYCPCHAAHFDLDGKRLDGVSPRDLDSLEIKVENGHVFVKFQNFTFGITEKRS